MIDHMTGDFIAIPWPDSLVKGYTFFEHSAKDCNIKWEIRGHVDDQIIMRHPMPSGNSYIYKVITLRHLLDQFHTSRFNIDPEQE